MKSGVKYFFWVCFAAFLLASIPHVAYFFRAYEPQATGAGDLWQWGVSYAIAGSIDLTIFLLSMTVANMQRANKPGGLIFSVWVFILALAALSWFINYKYAMKFVDAGMISATPVNIAGVNLGDINPLVASMFQIMAIAYTWISDKLLADVPVKTAAELQQEAAELKLAAAAQLEIAAIKRERRVNNLKGLINAGADVTKHAKSQLIASSQENEETPVDEIEDQSTDPITDKFTSFNLHSIDANQGQEESNQSAFNSQETGPLPTSEHPALTGLSGRDSVVIDKAADIVGCQVKYIQSLVKEGKLNYAGKSKDRVTVASIKRYLATRRPRKQSPVIEPLKQAETPEKETVHLGMIERTMFDAIQKATPADRQELYQLASEKPLNEFTNDLRTRYPEYASYITEDRVSHVMQAMGIEQREAAAAGA